ncbi:MAG: hypothetical protein ACYDCQ_17465 [Dehalococcoidia bacterium]
MYRPEGIRYGEREETTLNQWRQVVWAFVALALIALTSCSSKNNGAKTATAAPVGTQSAPASTKAPTAPAPATGTAPIDGLPCESSEQLTYHVHAHLGLIANGQVVLIPAMIGINNQQQCIYWLHTHDTTGVIHIEAPASRAFTLGQFFDVWHQPLDATHAAAFTAEGANSLMFYVDGKQYSGDPRQIPLQAHTQIVIEWGDHFLTPPPNYQFPTGL